MKIVEIIMFMLEIHAEVTMLVGLVGVAQKLLSRCYTFSNLDLAECFQ